jgi:hypothetical protein
MGAYEAASTPPRAPACGLGAELAAILPALSRLRRRRRSGGR